MRQDLHMPRPQRLRVRTGLLATFAGLVLLAHPQPVAAQRMPAAFNPDSAPARRGTEVVLPVVSFIVPGVGQYAQGATRAGLAYSGATLVGIAISTAGDPWGDTWDGDAPRRPRDQLAEAGLSVWTTAGGLSAWDSFHRSVPALQRKGKYTFLDGRDGVTDLLSAPFDPRFLNRWTTWVDFAQTAAITALILSERKQGAAYVPFRSNDAAYVVSASAQAAIGEEALFRGWLLPLLNQQTGQRFWLANGLQAGAFGAAHLPDAEWYAAVIAGWAAWEGWVVRRNGWSVRESIFHHFWYDVAIFSATLIVEERDAELRLTFPSITF